MHTWKLADLPAQTGRRFLITGANSGIGFQAALELARLGGDVVLASRDQAKAEAARARILAEVPAARLELALLDLASLASVRSFAQRELANPQPLDVLVNNAGVMAPPKRLETADGFELQFGTNVLGHFALTALLLPKLERSPAPQPRVVTVASIAHKRGRLHFDDLQWTRDYQPMAAYQQSKLADLMFALELDRHLREAGSSIASIAAHPGVANTNLFQAGNYGAAEKALRSLGGRLIGALMNTDTEGALPTLFAAAEAEAEPGGYYGPQGLAETRGAEVGPAKIAPQARDTQAARRLWSTCEQLTGTRMLDGRG